MSWGSDASSEPGDRATVGGGGTGGDHRVGGGPDRLRQPAEIDGRRRGRRLAVRLGHGNGRRHHPGGDTRPDRHGDGVRGGPASGIGRPVTPARPKSTGTPKQPASFDPARDITDLITQTSGLRLAKPVGGIRHGELTVTIRNAGPNPLWHLTMIIEVPASMTADGGDWAGCTRLAQTKAGFPAGSKCDKGYLAAGQSLVLHFRMKSPASMDAADSRESRWLVDAWSGDGREMMYRDGGPDDNRRIFMVYRA
ncbi:hypothetical protein [Micromonospora zhanjiangensis]